MTRELKIKFEIGKPPAQINAEILPGSEQVKASPPTDSPLLLVPEGLSRCPVCNEFRGAMALRELPDPHGLYQDEDPKTPLRVQCICDGILCPRCKINRIRRPISNMWSERGGFGHIPYFAAMIPCDECRANQKAEEDAAREKRRSHRNQ